MKYPNPLLFLFISGALMSCAVQTPITNQYRLDPAPVTAPLSGRSSNVSLLIAPPNAAAGYQTQQMLYVQRPHEIRAFAHNAWSSDPASMLYPLLVQGMQNSGYFYAVASAPSTSRADYQLDTQLIELQQNFIKKPSVIELKLNAVLTRSEDNQVIASRLFHEHIPCPQDTPYGGAVAANQAAHRLTQSLVGFVIQQIKHPLRQKKRS